MSANPRVVMANSWLRWAYADEEDVIVITAAYVGEELQFLATIKHLDGQPDSILAYRRSRDAGPFTITIPLRPNKDFVFDEAMHDLTNVADIQVFRDLHQSAADGLFPVPDDMTKGSAKRFQVIDGGKS